MVLIVESSEDTRQLYRLWMEMSGLAVEEARNGADAISKARERRPDVVVTDLVLPDCDGVELVRQLRAHDHTRDVAIVVVTGYTGARLHRALRRQGPCAVLLKPCQYEHLRDEVLRALESSPGRGALVT